MDNYYTSLALFEYLRGLGFKCTGTLRKNRAGFQRTMNYKEMRELNFLGGMMK